MPNTFIYKIVYLFYFIYIARVYINKNAKKIPSTQIYYRHAFFTFNLLFLSLHEIDVIN